MKILHILPSLAKGGPSLVVKELVDTLAQKGHQITVGYFDDCVEVEFSEDVEVIRLSFSFNQRFLSNFDIVHTHLYRPDIYALINRPFIKKHVSTVHSDIYQFMSITYGKTMGAFYSFVWALSTIFFNKLVFLTKFQKNKYLHLSKFTSSTVIPNGCKPAVTYEDAKSYPSFTGKIILGSCAHVVHLKRLDQILKLLCYDEEDQYRFVLVGDGPNLQALKTLAIKLNVVHKVFFVGRSLDISPFLKSFDIFLMTSESEGMPMALLEAASCNRAIVSSNLPVIKEIFSTKEVSFFELDNLESLQSAVLHAYLNKETLGRNAFCLYHRCYTNAVMATSYENLYLELGK